MTRCTRLQMTMNTADWKLQPYTNTKITSVYFSTLIINNKFGRHNYRTHKTKSFQYMHKYESEITHDLQDGFHVIRIFSVKEVVADNELNDVPLQVLPYGKLYCMI